MDRDDDALAGEYVLRVLDGDELAAFRARLAAEPALRQLVAGWEARLAPMADEVAEVQPPGRTKKALERRLFGGEARPRFPIFGFLGGAVTALVLAGLVMVALPPPSDMLSAPAFSAEVASGDGSLIVLASIHPPEHIVVVDRRAGAAPQGSVLELWVIAEGQPGPLSLGVLPEDAVARLAVPQAVQDAGLDLSTATLAISVEPPGGSPTGLPTGAVLALGPVQKL